MGVVEKPTIHSAVVAVGEELLSGQTTDTNGSWLSQRLASLGAPVFRRWVVGDRPSEIQDAVRAAVDVAELVIVTGGLGPTEDDLTRRAVADCLGLDLVVDPVLLQGLRDRFRVRGHADLPPSNLVQAEVPEGAEVLPNARGSAPGLWIDVAGRLVTLLPGVPREMRGIFDEELAPRVRERFGSRLSPLVERTFHTTGIPESVLGERIETVRGQIPSGVRIASLPDLRGVSIRIATRSSEEGGRVCLDQAEAVLEPIIGPYRFDAASGSLIEALARELIDAGLSMTVAESCTGGLMAKRITDLPGSSAYFHGGVVAYADRVKVDVLGVDETVLLDDGAVSEAVAVGMARGAAELFRADVAVGVTGVAGPEGGSKGKPVGLVWYAASVQGRVESANKVFSGDREAVREQAAQAAFLLVFRMLTDRL